ncbi:signal peptide peptidase SppA [candidate division KSB1 bacterium]|nr:signal peptide peptidase SppA [candidate division KSB1 bacterium]
MESNPPAYSPASGAQQPPPRRRTSGCIIAIVVVAFIFIALIVMMVGFLALLRGSFASKPITIKPNTVVQLRASGSIKERAATNPFSLFASGQRRDVTFFDALTAIRSAKDDDHVIGLYYRAGELRCGMAKALELRDAILNFKTSGKFVYAFIEFGGELDYLFASVADSIYMPVEGLLELNGFAIQDIFWPDTFDKLGIKFHVDQFEEYKSAGETYTRKNFSPYARESLRALVQQYYDALVSGIAHSRNLDPRSIRAAMNRGVYTADGLMQLGFIDHIKPESNVKDMILYWRTESDDSIKTQKGKNRLIGLPHYIQGLASRSNKGQVVRDKQLALISATGLIIPGDVESTPFLSEDVVASNTFIRYLRQAREDNRIKAIILRIDSPGGSVLAADAIWEEVRKTKEKKPVYASMSDVAASGGYYIAMACDSIIAHPETITGSIGVISTIPNLSGTLAKIGAHVDTVATSPSALFLDPYMPFSEKDKRKLRRLSAGVYERFVNRVAESRNKTFAQTRQVARGRVWTGEAAFQHGLVDTLGGLQTALNLAKRRIGVTPEQKVRLRMYPPPEDPIDAFFKLFEQLSEQKSGREKLRSGDFTAHIPLWHLWPNSIRRQFIYFYQLNTLSEQEKTLMAMPYLPEIH